MTDESHRRDRDYIRYLQESLYAWRERAEKAEAELAETKKKLKKEEKFTNKYIRSLHKMQAERDHYKAALSDLLQTVFIWVLDEPYFRTRGGIPMEIAERYVRVIHRAKHALEGKT